MIKVPLRDLREALDNPAAYVRKRKNTAPPIMRRSMFMTLRDAALHYHKVGNKLADAQDYLEDKFKIFRDQRKLPEYSRQLDVYVQEFQRLKADVVKTRDNLALTLPDKYGNFVVSGQASRIDLKPQGGYSIWTFARNDLAWRDDPRMPLLQQAYADKLDASLDEIEVGIYDFVTETHESVQFDASAIRSSQRKLLRLLDAFI
jgi:hypothetical protein